MQEQFGTLTEATNQKEAREEAEARERLEKIQKRLAVDEDQPDQPDLKAINKEKEDGEVESDSDEEVHSTEDQVKALVEAEEVPTNFRKRASSHS